MAAAASFQTSTSHTDDTISHKLFYQYLTDATLYELLSRVNTKQLDENLQSAIHNSSDADLNGITAHASIIQNSRNDDIYILIQVKLHTTNIGHITLHLIPFNTSSNTIGPLHIRNNTSRTRVSRIKVVAQRNAQRIHQIWLSRGSAPNACYGIGNIKIIKACEQIFSVLNNYLDKTSLLSLTIPSPQTNYYNDGIRDLVREITRPYVNPSRRHAIRIQRTRFSNQYGIRGGSCKRRTVHKTKRYRRRV